MPVASRPSPSPSASRSSPVASRPSIDAPRPSSDARTLSPSHAPTPRPSIEPPLRAPDSLPPRGTPLEESRRIRDDLAASLRREEARRDLFTRLDDPAQARKAKARADDLAQRRAVVDDILKRDPELKLHTPDDLDLVAGRRTALSPDQVARAGERLAEHGNSWDAMKSSLKGNPPAGKEPLSKFEMFRAGRHRQEVVDGMLKDVLDKVRKERGITDADALKPQAFGSTNLTSDYDLSIAGAGAEDVAVRFNDEFRTKFKCESGTMFDTNVYTDPVYNLDFFGRQKPGLSGIPVNPRQADAARQFVYGQTAMRKYLPDADWAKHRARMIEAAPDELKPMTQHALDAAERSHRGGRVLEDDWLKKNAGWDGTRDAHGNRAGLTPDQELRARNETYGKVLRGIGEHRDELSRLQRAVDGGGPVPTDVPFLRDNAVPGYRAAVDRLNGALARGDAAGAAAARADAEGWLAQQLRNRQGNALYYASEAYQTEGAIGHVVGELQAAGRPVTYDSLTSATRSGGLDRERYVESFYENQANRIKELEHVRGPDGKFPPAEVGKAMEKTSKYFIRELDAAHQTGVDLAEALGKDSDALLRQAAELAAARGDDAKWAATIASLQKQYPGFTPEAFVANAEAAASRLSGEMLKRSPLRDLAPAFNQTPEGMRAAARVR